MWPSSKGKGEVMVRRRYTPDEVEAAMIPKIVDAIYPLLIPMEQQDCRIQAKNHALMTDLAKKLWRSFCASHPDGTAEDMAHREDATVIKKQDAEIARLRARITRLCDELDMAYAMRNAAKDKIKALAEESAQLREALENVLLDIDFMVDRGIIPDVRNDMIYIAARAALGTGRFIHGTW
jgi:hypothetical protein